MVSGGPPTEQRQLWEMRLQQEEGAKLSPSIIDDIHHGAEKPRVVEGEEGKGGIEPYKLALEPNLQPSWSRDTFPSFSSLVNIFSSPASAGAWRFSGYPL